MNPSEIVLRNLTGSRGSGSPLRYDTRGKGSAFKVQGCGLPAVFVAGQFGGLRGAGLIFLSMSLRV